MTTQIALTLLILLISVVLFITEKIRIDLTALLVLGSLALLGLVTPDEALSGFSNPAVVTVWAVFILSGGLSRTGVANIIGKQVLRLAGTGEVRLILVIMLTSGFLSAFMNNVGVAAMFLPVVMNIARQTNRPPSKLLMPLAYGTLLGGLTTLIGTPPNILASNALRDAGLSPYRLFDFAPVGGAILLVGVAYMLLIGRRLLPSRDLNSQLQNHANLPLNQVYDIDDQMCIVRLPAKTELDGKTLAESRLGSILGLNVLAIIRNGKTNTTPGPEAALAAGDRLLVSGSLDRLKTLQDRKHLLVETEKLNIESLVASDLVLAEVSFSVRSPLLGNTLQEIGFRAKYGVTVLAIWRGGQEALHSDFDLRPLQGDDVLLVQGSRVAIDVLREQDHLLVSQAEHAKVSRLGDRLLAVTVPADSTLAGKTLAESRLAEGFGLTVIGLLRDGVANMNPDPSIMFEAGDRLLVKGNLDSLNIAQSLQDLQVDVGVKPDMEAFESNQVGMVEAVLSPRSSFAEKTLRQLHFREKFGLSVLALMRGGVVHRTGIRNLRLRFGDGLLLFGKRDKFAVLADDPDIILLDEDLQEPVRSEKAWVSASLMVAVVISVLTGWLPISTAAVIGASLMVLTGCLKMDEAYRAIDWRAVFLIAGMLPLGIAMQNTGAANYLADGMITSVAGYGEFAILIGIFLLTSLASQFMPNAVVTVLMAQIAINTATGLGLSPYTFMMVVAIAASASFLSPVGHPANVLIMGPGGYRFSDYIKVGFPLMVVILVTVLVVLPVFWPLK